MPFDPSMQTLIMIAVGALAACILEAASDRKLLSRFVAHVIGANTVLLIVYARTSGHSWQDLQAVFGYLSGRPQLLFVWISALATAVVEEAVGTNLFLCFVLHLFGMLVVVPLLGEVY
jgi:hypothetical protein